MQENLSPRYANNKRADQPAHPRSLISAFVIRSLESIVSALVKSKISIVYLVNLPLAETQRTNLT